MNILLYRESKFFFQDTPPVKKIHTFGTSDKILAAILFTKGLSGKFLGFHRPTRGPMEIIFDADVREVRRLWWEYHRDDSINLNSKEFDRNLKLIRRFWAYAHRRYRHQRGLNNGYQSSD